MLLDKTAHNISIAAIGADEQGRAKKKPGSIKPMPLLAAMPLRWAKNYRLQIERFDHVISSIFITGDLA